MIKVLLIDDEERATNSLQLMIEKFIPDTCQVWACNDARKATGLIHKLQPDLVFLDIRMPHLSGFELLKLIPKKKFKVIFTTAYNEYAIQSIRFSAFDYLLKPIDSKDLIDAVNRFSTIKDELLPQESLFKNMANNMKMDEGQPFRLALPSKEGVHFFFPAEIIRCEAEGNYTKFFTITNKQHLTSKTLGEYEDLLNPYGFIRTHKSHLVNKSFISFIDPNCFLILKDSSKVEISRRRKADVMLALKS